MISVILKNKQKTKQRQISKIEKTTILIEIPKTQNKNESNLSLPNKKTQLKVTFYTQTYKIEKKNVSLSMSVPTIWWSKSGKGADGVCFK